MSMLPPIRESFYSPEHLLAHGINEPIHVCKRCGAVVPGQMLGLHFEWHEKLRRAMEEGDFIE